MNVRLLRKVQKYILEEPKRFDLEFWGASIDPKEFANLDQYASAVEHCLAELRPPCGAIGCIAGNTLIVAGAIKPKELHGKNLFEFGPDTLEKAAKLLKIDNDSAKRLFYLKEWGQCANGEVIGWPEPFASELSQSEPGTKEYAQTTSARIDHFIATNGRE